MLQIPATEKLHFALLPEQSAPLFVTLTLIQRIDLYLMSIPLG